jgi:hypothetical protein
MKLIKLFMYIALMPFCFSAFAAGSSANDTSTITLEKSCVNGALAGGDATVSDSINNPTLSVVHSTSFDTNDLGATLAFTDVDYDKGSSVTLSETAAEGTETNAATASASGAINSSYVTSFTALNGEAEGAYVSTITATCSISA